MPAPPLPFIRRGQPVALRNVPPDRTLLDLLREDLGCTGTKEGCGEGDCGACTVVLGAARGGRLHYSAVNSCIRLAHSIAGQAMWTVQDLAQDPLIWPDGNPAARLHPVQEAMVQCHGSQCGFCTPGFVMSLFALYQNQLCQGRLVTREMARQELSGNLCRCTGYRPILDAAEQMARLPAQALDESALLRRLEHIAHPEPAPAGGECFYLAPTTVPDLLAARAAFAGAQIVAGATDVGLWITRQHRQYAQLIDVTRAAPLQQIVQHPEHIAIGAAVTLTDAFAALTAQWPQLHCFATRFAALPVRNSGTLGGNVANGSPIGDSMPLLIALRAQVVLASTRGERRLALQDFYTGYRQTVLAPDELLLRILVPRAAPAGIGTRQLRAYKVSKRFDDDISTVCLVLNLDIADGAVQRACIGAGGVAATPARARQTEAALIGQPWNPATVSRAAAALQAEFRPISDMRASSAYRSAVLAGLLQRFWLDSQERPHLAGQPPLPLSLEDLRPHHLETVA